MPPRCSFAGVSSSSQPPSNLSSRRVATDAREGDVVQTALGEGVVLKRVGTRLRVQFADSTAWVELNDARLGGSQGGAATGGGRLGAQASVGVDGASPA